MTTSAHDRFDVSDVVPAEVPCASCGAIVRDLRLRCADCRERVGDTPEAARYYLLVNALRRLA